MWELCDNRGNIHNTDTLNTGQVVSMVHSQQHYCIWLLAEGVLCHFLQGIEPLTKSCLMSARESSSHHSKVAVIICHVKIQQTLLNCDSCWQANGQTRIQWWHCVFVFYHLSAGLWRDILPDENINSSCQLLTQHVALCHWHSAVTF